MIRKLLKDIQREQKIYDVSSDIHSRRLGEYYFVMEEKKLRSGYSQDFHFDEQGIPIIPTYIDVEERKLVYYPISIGQYGLAIFHTWLKSGAESDRDRFMKIVNWFYENRQTEPRRGDFWLTDVPKPEYRLFDPWPSAFSQSRAISILLRGYQLTGEEKYLEVATKALKIFEIPAAEGGVTTFTKFGPFYEEYPAPFPTMVLDGTFFSLCGLWDYARVVRENKTARRLFDEGVQCLVKILSWYDLGYWIRYNYCQEPFYPAIDPASIGYFRLVLSQLELFYKITGREEFQDYATRWKRYDRLSNILKMYQLKYKALKKMNRL